MRLRLLPPLLSRSQFASKTSAGSAIICGWSSHTFFSPVRYVSRFSTISGCTAAFGATRASVNLDRSSSRELPQLSLPQRSAYGCSRPLKLRLDVFLFQLFLLTHF